MGDQKLIIRDSIKKRLVIPSKNKLREEEHHILSVAHAYVETGFSVMPLKKLEKRPSLSNWKFLQERLPTRDEIESWFGYHPDLNIGIITGEISGISVLDLDHAKKEEDDHGWENLKKGGWIFPSKEETPIIKTPHGYQIYYDYDKDMPTTTNFFGYKNVDTRNDGGYVVAPPSVVTCDRGNQNKYSVYSDSIPCPLHGSLEQGKYEVVK